MLTIEEIKKAIDEFKPDWFEIRENVTDYLYCGNRLVCDLYENIIHVHEYYDLFLDRVIQGMNRIPKILITTDDDEIHIMIGIVASVLLQYNGTTEGIREAREKAIRFVLEELGCIKN